MFRKQLQDIKPRKKYGFIKMTAREEILEDIRSLSKNTNIKILEKDEKKGLKGVLKDLNQKELEAIREVLGKISLQIYDRILMLKEFLQIVQRFNHDAEGLDKSFYIEVNPVELVKLINCYTKPLKDRSDKYIDKINKTFEECQRRLAPYIDLIRISDQDYLFLPDPKKMLAEFDRLNKKINNLEENITKETIDLLTSYEEALLDQYHSQLNNVKPLEPLGIQKIRGKLQNILNWQLRNIKDYKEQIDKLEKNSRDFEKRLEKATKTISEYEEEINKKNREISEINKGKIYLNNLITKLGLQLEKKGVDLKITENSSTKDIIGLDLNFERLNKEKDELKNELSTLKKDKTNLERNLDDSSIKKKQIDAEIETITKEILNLDQNLSRKDVHEITRQNIKEKFTTEKTQHLAGQLINLIDERKALNDLIEQYMQEIEKLNRDIAAAEINLNYKPVTAIFLALIEDKLIFSPEAKLLLGLVLSKLVQNDGIDGVWQKYLEGFLKDIYQPLAGQERKSIYLLSVLRKWLQNIAKDAFNVSENDTNNTIEITINKTSKNLSSLPAEDFLLVLNKGVNKEFLSRIFRSVFCLNSIFWGDNENNRKQSLVEREIISKHISGDWREINLLVLNLAKELFAAKNITDKAKVLNNYWEKFQLKETEIYSDINNKQKIYINDAQETKLGLRSKYKTVITELIDFYKNARISLRDLIEVLPRAHLLFGREMADLNSVENKYSQQEKIKKYKNIFTLPARPLGQTAFTAIFKQLYRDLAQYYQDPQKPMGHKILVFGNVFLLYGAYFFNAVSYLLLPGLFLLGLSLSMTVPVLLAIFYLSLRKLGVYQKTLRQRKEEYFYTRSYQDYLGIVYDYFFDQKKLEPIIKEFYQSYPMLLMENQEVYSKKIYAVIRANLDRKQKDNFTREDFQQNWQAVITSIVLAKPINIFTGLLQKADLQRINEMICLYLILELIQKLYPATESQNNSLLKAVKKYEKSMNEHYQIKEE